MSAVPINDNTAFITRAIIRDLALLDTVDLRQVIAASIGLLHDKMGLVHTSKIVCHIMDAVRALDEPMSLHAVALHIAQKHQIPVEELRKPYVPEDKANPLDIAHARHEAFWLARKQFKPDGRRSHSYPQIGRFFGDRDHTTVIAGVRSHERRVLSGEASL